MPPVESRRLRPSPLFKEIFTGTKKNFLLAMGLIVAFLLLWSVFVIPRFAPTVSVPDGSSRFGGTSSESAMTAARHAAGLKSAHAEMSGQGGICGYRAPLSNT